MSKIIKNTTGSEIDLLNLGLSVPSMGQITLAAVDFLLLSSEPSVNELSALITSGDIVINDGNSDLTASEAINYIKYPDNAKHIRFDNTITQFAGNPENVQDAIESINLTSPSKFYAQFQKIGSLNNSEYLYSFFDTTGNQQEKSGNISNGYRYGNSSPIICPFDGTVKIGVFAIKGVAVSTGSAAAVVTVNAELWAVGFQGEGTKLGDVNLDINSSQFTIGNGWNSSIDTNFTGSNSYNISVTQGSLLALKFIRVQNNSNAVSIRNFTVVLEIEGSV